MKKMYILILILFALMASYYFFRTYPRQAAFEAPAAFVTGSWTDENIDAIELRFTADESLTLTETNGMWQVEQYEADGDRITQLFEALGEAQVTSRVSSNAQNHERFEVDERQAVAVTLRSGQDTVQEMLVGKTAGGQSVYVRLPGENDVYVLSGFPRYLVSKELDIWRDRQIVDLEPAQMRAVAYEQAAGWNLRQSENGWALAQGALAESSVDEQKTLSWLARLRSLQAVDFGDETTEYGVPIAEFVVEEGTPQALTAEHRFEVYPAADTSQLLIVHESELLFIQKDTFEQLFVPYLELLEELTAEAPTE